MKIADLLHVLFDCRLRPASHFAALALPCAALLGLTVPAHPVFAAEADYRADSVDASEAQDDSEPDPGTYARVRFFDGTLKLERYEDETVDEGSANAPIMPGDTAATSGGGRAEIQLAGGTIVRLDENTRLSFLSLPGVDEPGDDATLLQILEGSAEIEVRSGAQRKGDFQIDTAAASVYLLANGRYRIDTDKARGSSRVSTYRGVAEVAGDEGSVMLRSGQRTSVEGGSEPDDGRVFNTASQDSFDAWVQGRGAEYFRASAWHAPEDIDEEEIPDSVKPYRSELSYYGRWVSIPQYGPCWMPAGVGTGWRPYYNGYWSTGRSGSFWVSSDPWGWAPYHFGRWNWFSGYGWVWIPGRVFSGAWVSWYYGPSYVGWAPLDFWNNPGSLSYGSAGIDYHCWNFVTYQNVYVKHVTKIYVNPAVVRPEIVRGTGVIVRRPVRVTPLDIRTRRLTPDAVIRRARSFGSDAVVDPVRVRVTKRGFVEREKEIARMRPELNRRVDPARPGSGGASGLAGGSIEPGVPVPRGLRVQPGSGRKPGVNSSSTPGTGIQPGSERRRTPERIQARPPRLYGRGSDPSVDAVPPGRRTRGDAQAPPRAQLRDEAQRRDGAQPPPGASQDVAPPESGTRHESPAARDMRKAPAPRRRRLADTGDEPASPSNEESGAPAAGLAPDRPGPADTSGAAAGDQPLREFLRETGKRPVRTVRETPQIREAPEVQEDPPVTAEPDRDRPEQRRTRERAPADTAVRPEDTRPGAPDTGSGREEAPGAAPDNARRHVDARDAGRERGVRPKPEAGSPDKNGSARSDNDAARAKPRPVEVRREKAAEAKRERPPEVKKDKPAEVKKDKPKR